MSKAITLLRNIFPVLFIVAVLFFILRPAITLPLPGVTYVDLEVIVHDFGKDLSFLHPPLKYYVYHYGTQFTSILTAYKLFGFNPLPWFIIDIFLRITAAVAIYLFTAKWSKSKLAGVVAAIFFGANLPGIQPTTRVAFFLVYGAVISLFVFLDRWLRFHYQPSGKNLKLSALFFVLAILTYPIRMVGTIPLVFIGEIYWLLKSFDNKDLLKLWLKHLLLLIAIILSFVFITGTLSSTPELSFKRVSPTILFVSLLTGYPPAITTLWLFISNIIVSPILLVANFNATNLSFLTVVLPFLGIIFFLSCILHKKFLLAFASLIAITFAPFVLASAKNLDGWDNNFIVVTQIGGSLFILSNLFLIFIKNRNERLTKMGLLGSFIVLSAILFPFLISPQMSNNDQSAFNFIHRYYTIPSAGMGILLGSVVAGSWDWLKNGLKVLLNLKTRLGFFQLTKDVVLLPVLLCIPILIVYFTYGNVISTNNLLTSIGKGTDASKIELFWNKIEPSLNNIKEPPAINDIYINNLSDIDNKYLKEMIADRIIIRLKIVDNPPKINLFFTQPEFMEILNKNQKDNIYAFEFDGKEVINIKEKLFNTK